MTYIKYFWGFDSSVEGWTGTNVVWEAGGNGGLPTGHIKGSRDIRIQGNLNNVAITFKSPRNLNINSGDYLCFVFTWDLQVYELTYRYLSKIVIQVVDNNENVVWSGTIGRINAPRVTPLVCIAKIGGSGVGINIQIFMSAGSYVGIPTYHLYARLDSVTIYSQPDQIIHTPIPATLQSKESYVIPINRQENVLVGVMRLGGIQNTTQYSSTLKLDGGATTINYGNGVIDLKTANSSVDEVDISITADSTLQVYYECDHAIWLLDPNTYYPKWLYIIKCYHNQNPNNPDYVSFSTILNNSTYSETKSVQFKFVCNQIFNVVITPTREIIGDTTGINSFTAKITVKDSNGNVIGSCNYDVLNDTYDQQIKIPNTYDGQDLTIDIEVNASGTANETVTTYLKLKYDYTVQ